MPTVDPLKPDSLYTPCDAGALQFKTTAELDGLDDVAGHSRALSALQYGIHVKGDGCNIFAVGPAGIPKHRIVARILEREASGRPVSSDWCYVWNFDNPHKPRAIEMPPGRGSRFCREMEQLIEDLGTAIPSAFETEEYQSRVADIEKELIERRDEMLQEIDADATQRRIRFLHTPSGFAFAPLDAGGEVIDPEHFSRLSDQQKEKIEANVKQLQERLQKVIRQFPIWQKETREKIKEVDREIAHYAVEHLIDGVRENHLDLPEVCRYLEDVEKDIVEHVREFRQQAEPQMMIPVRSGTAEALRRYKVNVMIDHAEDASAAVVFQDLPTYSNLVGRIEYQAQMGTLLTDFTLIKAGDLHRANGGYLVLDADRLLRQPFAWEGLKRALRSHLIRIEPLERAYGLMNTSSLEPEPIPLDVKVVLVGERLLYYLMHRHDPEFEDLFGVIADFSAEIDRDEESAMSYARLVARIVKEEDLLPLERGAVARVIDYASRLAEDAARLSVDIRRISNLLRGSNYSASVRKAAYVTADDVQAAIDARTHRHDRIREDAYDSIGRDIVKIDVTGEVVGQLNGLSVIDLGDFSFGLPSRITATTRLGEGKFLDIQRETRLGGKIHSKGVLILTSYLASRYASEYPLSMSASVVFEQSYGMVDGDSASLAELCVLLSALSKVPMRQSIAVTGSVNQRGEVQAVGGVNQKIEGFFDVCSNHGLNGTQAVIIPASNVPHLMLRKDVVEAVENGMFSVYAVDKVDDAVEILTGLPAGAGDKDGELPLGSVNGKVERALIDLALRRREFAREDGNEQQS